MQLTTNAIEGALAEAGRGEATQLRRELFDRQGLATVRYADPAAWVTATAIRVALGSLKDQVLAERDRVGVIVTSSKGPAEAQAAVADAASRGLPSPLRYAAANPGSLVGVPCILLGFRGPTLNLLSASGMGSRLGLLAAAAWLKRGVATYVLLAKHGRRASDKHLARALLLTLHNPQAPLSLLDESEAVKWLNASSA